MDKLFLYCCIMLVSVFISSVSQIMLKLSARKQYADRIKEYLNPLVFSAYLLFFSCTFITMYALKVVPLMMAPIIESTGYIFVAVLGWLFLKERISVRKWLGLAVIIFGILIYSF